MTHSFTRRSLAQAGAIGVGAVALNWRTPLTLAQESPQAGGSIQVGRAGDFLNFDPFFAYTVNLPMYRQLYNTLVVYDDELNVVPQLAQSWEFSEDRLTLTFNLQQGVPFHNGREFVADDVVQNLARAADDTLGHSVLGYTTPISNVTALDDHTVEFTFSEQANAIFDLLTVLGMAAPESFEAPAITNPVGTGPFSFVEWNPGQETVFARFEDYWEDGLPYLDEVVVRAMPDPQSAVASLEAGELDIMQAVPYNEVPRLEESELEILLGPEGAQFYTFYFNTVLEPFDQSIVRQALSHAIDRQTIVDTVLFGVGKASQTPFPEWSLAYDPAHVDWFPYDLERAQELLTEAGIENLETTVVTISDFPEMRNMAQIIQADLATIGVDLSINDVSSADWGQIWPAKDYETMISTAGFSHKDPSTLFNSMSGFRLEDNRTNFSPPTYRDLVTSGAGLADEAERQEVYHELAEFMLDQAFALVISFRYSVFGMQPSVRDLRIHLDDDLDLTRTWLSQ